MAYVVQCHVKVPHFPSESYKYLNFDVEMISRAPIVNKMLNSRHSEVRLDKFYYLYEVGTFKINNMLVCQIFCKIFMDTDAYVYVKQRRDLQDGQAVYFDIHKQFLGPDHVARQATKAEKLKTYPYDG